MNANDLDAFVACFGPDYRSEQPAHPNRALGGYAQVRANWATKFASVPDFHAELLRVIADRDTVWSESAWSGQRQDGSMLDMRGVIIFGVHNGLIAWAHLYMEETEPEDIAITPGHTDGLHATIEVIESMGAANVVYVRLGNQRIAVTTPPTFQAAFDDPVSLSFDPAMTHLFDPQTELRIAR